MFIKANKHPVIVNYKAHGKTYGHDTGEAGGPQAIDPFDSVTLQPGEEFTREDVDVINAKEIVPVASPLTQPGTSD